MTGSSGHDLHQERALASPNLAVSGQIPLPLLSLELMPPACSRRRGRWLRPQFGDQLKDLGEQHPRNGDLGHLKGDIAAVADELRATMGPHVVDILKFGLSVVLDFPANTVSYRGWMRSMITKANVIHELHYLDVPDTICKQRLRERNAGGKRPFELSESDYNLFTSYFVPPDIEEGFNVAFYRP